MNTVKLYKRIIINNQSPHNNNSLLKRLKFLSLLLASLIIPVFASDKYQFEDFESNLAYFKQITLGKYADNNEKRIVKWVNDINIFVKGELPSTLDQELELIVTELNQIIGNIKITRVSSEENANFLVFIGLTEQYREFETNASLSLKDIAGEIWMYNNADSEYTHGSMYINENLAKDHIYIKHILRKQLTQSLGIPYESPKYVDSIFAEQPFAQIVIEYSNFDKTIIKKLYSKCVKAGMDKFELDHALLNEC